MAWKRGVENNLPGVIRKGHIKEFLQPTSKYSSLHSKLKILQYSEDNDLFSSSLHSLYKNYPYALVCTIDNGLSPLFEDYIRQDKTILLHAHEHPKTIITALIHPDVPKGCIILKDYMLVNNKVCIAEIEDWSLFLGNTFKYDNREGVLGNTKLQFHSLNTLHRVIVSIKVKEDSQIDANYEISEKSTAEEFAKLFFHCVLTVDDIFVMKIAKVQYILRVIEVFSDCELENEENDITLPDNYRGFVDASTEIFIIVDEKVGHNIVLHNKRYIPLEQAIQNVVYILTSDDEVFPVKRRLLRPCLSLTSIVQAGKGKYAINVKNTNSHILENRSIDLEYREKELIPLNVDACTFDRVLLFLEHYARNEEFHFDPLIVTDLREAALVLQIQPLQDICDQILGSFQERVRRIPIRLEEIISRNNSTSIIDGKRKETIIILDGMVLDISRFLHEHPGGSNIIPEQALGVDASIFFEIYHVSRQSFLYLKEFYIGELAKEDLKILPFPTNCPCGTHASTAFLEQLRRYTTWRLCDADLQEKCIKSF